jgi:phosphate transport system substrate-binding protein
MRTISTRHAAAFLGAILFATACGGGSTPGPSGLSSPSASSQSASAPTAGILEATLTGAGATFPEPIYLEWIGGFQAVQPGVRINYQGIGSSGGREQFIGKKVDFAGSDAFMGDEDIAAALDARGCRAILHVPTLFGGVAIAYNIPGLERLTLDGATIAAIGLGTITNINDPAIAALNAGVSLPDQALTFVHRSDGSGTTNIFTTYLDDISDDWAAGPGRGSEVDWPTGLGGDGNDGVATTIAAQPGGIGYVSYEFAVESDLAVASVQNADGTAVAPSTESVSAAADTVEIPDDFRFSVLGVGGEGYPIVGATWILAPTCGMDASKGGALKAWLSWALQHGDSLATELDYAPLSSDLEARVLLEIERINEEG